MAAEASKELIGWLYASQTHSRVHIVPTWRHTHTHTPAGSTQDSETHLRATDPLPCWEPISPCSAYSCILIMMILNDEVSLNNDSQLKALNTPPCSRATGSLACLSHGAGI